MTALEELLDLGILYLQIKIHIAQTEWVNEFSCDSQNDVMDVKLFFKASSFFYDTN